MTEQPRRVQLSRAKGWRMPENTVKVDRATVWGNPFKVGDRVQASPDNPVAVCFSQTEAVEAYTYLINLPMMHIFRAKVVEHLRGKNLACWCPLDGPCHADTLLKMANAEPQQEGGGSEQTRDLHESRHWPRT
jgi:hypothetical protein